MSPRLPSNAPLRLFRREMLAYIRAIVELPQGTPEGIRNRMLFLLGEGREKPWPRKSPDGQVDLGVDLSKPEIRSAVMADLAEIRPPRSMLRDEFEAEVIAALLRKNVLSSAYDPRRGPLAAYVIVVAVSTRSNLRRRWRRHP